MSEGLSIYSVNTDFRIDKLNSITLVQEENNCEFYH